ncbi:hypothetical protein F511_14999 [Dorcoceras hygrometricum]|uniref:Uncharacterized protein n=1 Tax=Dorcoceras hygrometricum TaxID=472368 RepID=A0A2Z7A9R2_9LAMI|nr:hypothetical protein F511_14999 [Dorcoceras hygrometricum]
MLRDLDASGNISFGIEVVDSTLCCLELSVEIEGYNSAGRVRSSQLLLFCVSVLE